MNEYYIVIRWATEDSVQGPYTREEMPGKIAEALSMASQDAVLVLRRVNIVLGIEEDN